MDKSGFHVEMSGMNFFIPECDGNIVILFAKPCAQADRRVKEEYGGCAVSLGMERLISQSLLFV